MTIGDFTQATATLYKPAAKSTNIRRYTIYHTVLSNPNWLERPLKGDELIQQFIKKKHF